MCIDEKDLEIIIKVFNDSSLLDDDATKLLTKITKLKEINDIRLETQEKIMKIQDELKSLVKKEGE